MNVPEPVIVTPREAAGILLNHHCLASPQTLRTSDEALEYIRRVGCIQYDPLNVCGKNPDLVLQSRLRNSRMGLLETMLYTDRALLEGWDKMMAIYPAEDHPFLTRLRKEVSSRYISHYREVEEHLNFYLEEIRSNGPLSSAWFKSDEKIRWAWGSSRLAKAALECLFFQGRIAVHHRENTRRVYDLSERLIPAELLGSVDAFESDEAYRQAHILRRTDAAGIAGFTAGDFWHGIAETPKREIRRVVGKLIEEGTLKRLEIAGSSREWIISAKALEKAGALSINPAGRAVLLAPLDNMMWNRDLLEDIFSFRYRWEVYTPEAKREYGYYVLPILYRGNLIGRCEPRMDRKKNVMTLKGFWLQDGVKLSEEDRSELRAMFARFCLFHGAERMTTSPSLSREFRSTFKGINQKEISASEE